MSTAKPHNPSDPLATLRIDRTQAALPKRGSRLARLFWSLIFLVIVAVGGYFGGVRLGILPETMSWLQVPEIIQNLPQVQVETVAIQRGRSGDATVVATGYLESRRQAKIGARAAGRIQSVLVEEGSRVTQGEILAVLEHADMDAVLAATQASLARSEAALAEQDITIAQTKRDFERAKQLNASRNMSEAEFEQAKFTYDGAVARRNSLQADIQLAEARVKESEQLRENLFIRAPFTGTVISKDAEVGESILPGGMGEASGRGSAVTIADLEHLEVDCDVKEDYISRVTEGQQAEIGVDAVPNRRYHGRVRKIIPMGDRARATIKVKVEILDVDSRLFPDMSGTVYFLSDAASPIDEDKPRVFCSATAVVEGDSTKFVWMLDSDNRVSLTNIEILPAKDGRVEVVNGLSGGERLVTNPSQLRDGQRVRIGQ